MKILNSLRKLSPVETGPWWAARHYVYEQLRKIGVLPGDIICRLGNAYFYGFFSYSKLIAKITESKYSHASIIIDVTDDILLADVNTTGLRKQFIRDWCDEIRGDDILVLRFTGDKQVIDNIIFNVKKLLETNCDYYCIEFICRCFLQENVSLCSEITIEELPGLNRWLKYFAKFHGINTSQGVWCVGNKQIGLISSPYLRTVGKITLPERFYSVKISENMKISGA